MRKFQSLLLLPLLFLGFSTALYAQESEFFYFYPGLEVALPRSDWETKAQTYDDAMFRDGQKTIIHKVDGTKITFSCELIEEMEVSPDTVLMEVEEQIKQEGNFKKEKIDRFTVYFGPNRPDVEGFSCIFMSSHPFGYFTIFDLHLTGQDKAAAEQNMRAIISKIHLLTPREVDQKLGLPIPESANRDSMFAARIDVIRSKALQKYPRDFVDREIFKLKHEDVLEDALDGWSWEKRYAVRAQLKRGDFSLNTALDHRFLEKSSPEIQFYRQEFPTRDFALEHGISRVIYKSAYPKTDTAIFHKDVYFNNSVHFGSETFYWAECLSDDGSQMLLICVHRDGSEWKAFQRTIVLTKPNYTTRIVTNVEARERDPHDYDGTPNFKQYHRLNLLVEYADRETTNEVAQYVFNASAAESNILPLDIPSKEMPGIDVVYVWDGILPMEWRGALFQRPTLEDSILITPTFSKTLQTEWTIEKIKANKQMMSKMADAPVMEEYNRYDKKAEYHFEDEPSLEELEEDIKSIALEFATLDSKPAQRAYRSRCLFTDLTGDGQEEMFSITVSDGKLLDYQVFEATANGVALVPNSETLAARVEAGSACRLLMRLSSMPRGHSLHTPD